MGSLFQCLMTLLVKKFFLVSNLNLLWHNWRPFLVVVSLVTWGKKPNTHLATTSFQAIVENNKISPQPPFTQTKQDQFPQLSLVRLVF